VSERREMKHLVTAALRRRGTSPALVAAYEARAPEPIWWGARDLCADNLIGPTVAADILRHAYSHHEGRILPAEGIAWIAAYRATTNVQTAQCIVRETWAKPRGYAE
jgi:hypothetical protein